jgi:hypothetical protein
MQQQFFRCSRHPGLGVHAKVETFSPKSTPFAGPVTFADAAAALAKCCIRTTNFSAALAVDDGMPPSFDAETACKGYHKWQLQRLPLLLLLLESFGKKAHKAYLKVFWKMVPDETQVADKVSNNTIFLITSEAYC